MLYLMIKPILNANQKFTLILSLRKISLKILRILNARMMLTYPI